MKHINFLCISFYLLLNISTAKPMFKIVKRLQTRRINSIGKPHFKRFCQGVNFSKNPLMSANLYRDENGNHSLTAARNCIEKDEGYLVNSPGTENYCPLQWSCLPDKSSELCPEERLKIFKLFLSNGANDKSIRKASITCSKHKDYNSEIIPVLSEHHPDPIKETETEEFETSPHENPLTIIRTYRNKHGDLDFDKAKSLADEDKNFLVNHPEKGLASKNFLLNRPLASICAASLNKNEKEKIVKFLLENGANRSSIKGALLMYLDNIDNNASIIELLESHQVERNPEVKPLTLRDVKREQQWQKTKPEVIYFLKASATLVTVSYGIIIVSGGLTILIYPYANWIINKM